MIVAFPVFLIVSTCISRQLAARPESVDSGVRKWLTYIALVIATTILLGDAIFFLQNFLHGDLSVRFVLETIVLVTIVGSILGYYLPTLRGNPASRLRDRTFAGAAAAIVIVALACGFFETGTPQHERALAFDDRRIEDLVRIAGGMSSGDRSAALTLHDPITQAPYAVSMPAHGKYRLCARLILPPLHRRIRSSVIRPAGNALCSTRALGIRYARGHRVALSRTSLRR